MAKKFNKSQLFNLESILECGGVVPSSEWTTGTGRYITRRSLPPFCELLPVALLFSLRGEVAKNARRLLKERPRVQRIVVCTNLRAARAALRARSAA